MRFVVAAVDEIPSGGRRIVELAGRSIGVFNVGGEFYALRNRCPHQGGPICEGKLWGAIEAEVPGEVRLNREGEILTCAWHGWEFDIRTGQSWCDPRRLRVRSYDVRVEPGAALTEDPEAPSAGMVKGDYVAETFPVSVEGRYVVVEVGA
ncbi:MAG TPA: Rieske (2Fe-2S) protein [Candidatus Dormibacteraeota bacterium]|jgi:3-phenylpropionate/trans-cinnamate dioxygenase ferredoxin subunit|nr:Rieske (2Fe-2S) protein [Candidatus Dormibacteraeota bacterium]